MVAKKSISLNSRCVNLENKGFRATLRWHTGCLVGVNGSINLGYSQE